MEFGALAGDALIEGLKPEVAAFFRGLRSFPDCLGEALVCPSLEKQLCVRSNWLLPLHC